MFFNAVITDMFDTLQIRRQHQDLSFFFHDSLKSLSLGIRRRCSNALTVTIPMRSPALVQLPAVCLPLAGAKQSAAVWLTGAIEENRRLMIWIW